MIKTVSLKKLYRTRTVETAALDGVSLDIEKGEFVAIMGPSGCGKSTLLNLLGLIENPTDGQLFFLGQEVSRWSERRRGDLRKANIGFVFQSFNLIDDLTIAQNVELPLSYLRRPAEERRRRAEALLERMGIANQRNAHPHQLSGGQQQRAALARAMVVEPQVILADEPTGNLDSVRGAETMELLRQLNAAGTTVILVTHSPTDAACASRIIHLLDGRVVDAPPELLADGHLGLQGASR
ncbi:MAG TPA: ABC transporter ATP-binding protein [Thermoanaerobaculia bacterium]|nr:ABC transporter ATP-binding protein [Thermoanaerobaculia bacterium]